jgi:Shedu protein SduA, C-terminal
MGLLRPIVPDRRTLLREIEDFRSFLAGNPRAERSEFLPFFRARDQLCAYLATFNNAVIEADHVAHEFSLWGDFVCDTVSGSKRTGGFVFVEFEDAGETSLFKSIEGRRVSRWGTRVEAGLSQVTDWLFRLDRARNSSEMEREFGTRQVRPLGLVVAGRRSEVTSYDLERLNWRSEYSVIGGARIAIMTYDDLLEWLEGRASLVKGLDQKGEEQAPQQ